jgi:hypothetical protein
VVAEPRRALLQAATPLEEICSMSNTARRTVLQSWRAGMTAETVLLGDASSHRRWKVGESPERERLLAGRCSCRASD